MGWSFDTDWTRLMFAEISDSNGDGEHDSEDDESQLVVVSL